MRPLQYAALTLSSHTRQIAFPLSYLFNIDSVRTPVHILYVGACVRVLAKLGFASL